MTEQRNCILLPEWASGLAKGDYTKQYAALPTRDGRRTGNAVNAYSETRHGHLCYCVITDAGNIMWCSENEMKDLFYPPEFIMFSLLPAHNRALMKAAEL